MSCGRLLIVALLAFGGAAHLARAVGGSSFEVPDAAYTGLVNSNFSQTGFGFIQFRAGAEDRVTGKIFVDGLVVPFKGQFIENQNDATLSANATAKRGGQKLSLTVNITLQTDGLHFVGTLAGASAAPYSLAGERNGLGSSILPIPEAGVFNSLLNGNAVVPSGGDVRGIVRVTVKSTGSSSVMGTLPDGTKFSARSQISVLGHLFFAAGLYKKEQGKTVGYVAGSLSVAPSATPKTIQGTTRWNKPAGNGTIYPGGVANATLSLSGAQYQAPGKDQRALADFDASDGAANATLSAGNLSADIVKAVTLGTDNKFTVSAPGADKLKVTVTPSTGAIGGSFTHTDGKTRAITGLLVPTSPGRAEGLFAGTDEPGVIEIVPTP